MPSAAAELAGPEFPEACAYVWTWFCELHARPSSTSTLASAGGVATTVATAPISYAEIIAWAQLTRRRPQAWEVELLREIDMVWLAGPQKEAA